MIGEKEMLHLAPLTPQLWGELEVQISHLQSPPELGDLGGGKDLYTHHGNCSKSHLQSPPELGDLGNRYE